MTHNLFIECSELENNFKTNKDISIFVRRIFEIKRKYKTIFSGKYLLNLLKKYFIIPICPCYHFLNLIDLKKINNQDIEYYKCSCIMKYTEIPDIDNEQNYINDKSIEESFRTGIITRYKINDLSSVNKYYYLKKNIINSLGERQILDEKFIYEINKYFNCISCHLLGNHYNIYNSKFIKYINYLNINNYEAEIINILS